MASGGSGLAPEDRMTWNEYHERVKSAGVGHLLIDVRPSEMSAQFPVPEKDDVNIPLKDMTAGAESEGLRRIRELIAERAASGQPPVSQVVVHCHKGISSQSAVALLKPLLAEDGIPVKDIVGGWSEHPETKK